MFGLATVVALTIAMAALSWYAHREVAESVVWVVRARDIVRGFDALLQTTGSAETGQRGFLLVGEPLYLEPYTLAASEVRVQLARLRRAVAGDAWQEQRLDRLDQLIDRKFGELAETVALVQSSRRAAALDVVSSNRGRDLMEQIRREIAAGEAHEETILEERMARLNTGTAQRTYVTWALVGLNAVMLVLLAISVRRLQRLQPMVTLCAWSKTIKLDDEWITFEQYLDRRFGLEVTHGISPAQAERLLTGVEEARDR